MARKKKQTEPVNRTGYPIVKIFGNVPSEQVIKAIRDYLKALSFSNAYILEIPMAVLKSLGSDTNTTEAMTLVQLPIISDPHSLYPYTNLSPYQISIALCELHIALDKIPGKILIETYELKQEDISDPSDYRS